MLWHITCALITTAIVMAVVGLWTYGMCIVADSDKKQLKADELTSAGDDQLL